MKEKPFEQLCENVSLIRINLAELAISQKFMLEKFETLEKKLVEVEELHKNCPGKILGKKYNTTLHLAKDVSLVGGIVYFVLEKLGFLK